MLSSANRKDDEKLVLQKESPFWVAYNIKESEDGVIDFGQPRFRTKENMVEKGWHSCNSGPMKLPSDTHRVHVPVFLDTWALKGSCVVALGPRSIP